MKNREDAAHEKALRSLKRPKRVARADETLAQLDAAMDALDEAFDAVKVTGDTKALRAVSAAIESLDMRRAGLKAQATRPK